MKINRYKVILTDDGYVCGAYLTTGDDYDFEGNLAEYPDIAHGYYKIIDGVPTVDEEKKAEIESAESKAEELQTLTEELHSSDEDMLAFLEDLGSLNNPLTFISDLINLAKKYATLIATRKSIREQMAQLRRYK